MSFILINGTVTGTIEVFQVMAFTGGGMCLWQEECLKPLFNNGGMVASLSGVLAMIWVKNKVEFNNLMVDYNGIKFKSTRRKKMRRTAISAAARTKKARLT